MKSKTGLKKLSLLVSGIFLLFALSACGGGSAVKSDAPATAPTETQLEKKYKKIVFKKFQVDSAIEADYPGVVAQCENAAIAGIKSKNVFVSVETENAGTTYTDALVVKTRITSLRIVSGSARFWFGAAAGGSEMSLLMELIDASTGKAVREKALSTANNPFAATMTGGGTDRSLSSDLGNIMAEYISLIQPKNGKISDYSSSSSRNEAIEEKAPPAPQNDKISANAPSSSPVVKTLVVTRSAKMRSEPNNKSKTLITLKKGTQVVYLGESGTWLNVKLSTGATGWVSNSSVVELR
jgi:hypothetical protein